MSTETNPYASPASASEPDDSTPKSPKVIGIICIVFGTWGLLSGVGNLLTWSAVAQPFGGPESITVYDLVSREYLFAMMALGFATSLALLFAGIGLVKYRRWGRQLFLAYAVVAILIGIGNAVYMLAFVLPALPMENPLMHTSMSIGAVAGALSSCIFPVVCLLFLLRRRVAESLT